MKHKLLMLLKFTIAFALVAGMLALGSARAEFSTHLFSSGKFAYSDFIDDSNGQSISGVVQVSYFMHKSDPGAPVRPGPMGFVTLRIEGTDGEIVDDACSYQTGTATFELTSLNISNDLASAHVEGVGTLNWDQLSSGQVPPEEEVTIDITWTSEARISSGDNNFRSSYGDIRTHMHSSGTFRYATATGLIKGETFEVEVKPPPPPEPYPTPVPIPYEDSLSIIGRSLFGSISRYKR